MDIYLTASQFGKYPGLATSTSVNNCYLFYIKFKRVNTNQNQQQTERLEFFLIPGQTLDNQWCHFSSTGRIVLSFKIPRAKYLNEV